MLPIMVIGAVLAAAWASHLDAAHGILQEHSHSLNKAPADIKRFPWAAGGTTASVQGTDTTGSPGAPAPKEPLSYEYNGAVVTVRRSRIMPVGAPSPKKAAAAEYDEEFFRLMREGGIMAHSKL